MQSTGSAGSLDECDAPIVATAPFEPVGDPYADFNDPPDPSVDEFVGSLEFQAAVRESASKRPPLFSRGGMCSSTPLVPSTQGGGRVMKGTACVGPRRGASGIGGAGVGLAGAPSNLSDSLPLTGWSTASTTHVIGQSTLSAVRSAGFTASSGPSVLGPSGRSLPGLREGPRPAETGPRPGRALGLPAPLERKDEDTAAKRSKKVLKQINDDLNASCLAREEGKLSVALQKAKEAVGKCSCILADLATPQTQSGNSSVLTNVELFSKVDVYFSVHFNLAVQYEASGYLSNALSEYTMLLKNNPATLPGHMRVCIGNVYFTMGDYREAIKQFKMGLDQVSSVSYRRYKAHIMRNIAISFFRLRLYDESLRKFEAMMKSEPTACTGFSIILCHCALGYHELIKAAFVNLLSVPPPSDEENWMHTLDADSAPQRSLHEAMRADALRRFEDARRAEALAYILRAAKCLASELAASETYGAAYEWCIEQVKASVYCKLTVGLEIDKAIGFIRHMEYKQAADTLAQFDANYAIASGTAATNLAFLTSLSGMGGNMPGDCPPDHLDKLATIFVELALQADGYNPAAYVNKGNISFRRRDFEKAIESYTEAFRCDPSCVEAIFNLGLGSKRLGRYTDAIAYFNKLLATLGPTPQVLYQLGDLYDLIGESVRSNDCFVRLIGIVPSDSGVLRRMGDTAEAAGDVSRAFLYYQDAFHVDPTNVDAIRWLGAYYVRLQFMERALRYFERGALVQPDNSEWPLLLAYCHRRSGSIQRALELYQAVHRRHPDNVACLRCLVRLGADMNLREGAQYQTRLRLALRAERLKGRACRGGGGLEEGGDVTATLEEEHTRRMHEKSLSGGRYQHIEFGRMIESDFGTGSMDAAGGETGAWGAGEDGQNLGVTAAAKRPMTGAGARFNRDVDFGCDAIGDDLLPD